MYFYGIIPVLAYTILEGISFEEKNIALKGIFEQTFDILADLNCIYETDTRDIAYRPSYIISFFCSCLYIL